MIRVATLAWTNGLVFGLGATTDILDIFDIIHYSHHDKSSSLSQLIKDKLRYLQKLLKYLNGLMEQQPLCLMYLY